MFTESGANLLLGTVFSLSLLEVRFHADVTGGRHSSNVFNRRNNFTTEIIISNSLKTISNIMDNDQVLLLAPRLG